MGSKPHFTIRPGRHVGWWIDGRRSNDRRFLLWWWPTRRMAEWSLRVGKYFTPVSRIDAAGGDRNLICSCEPLEAYAVSLA